MFDTAGAEDFSVFEADTPAEALDRIAPLTGPVARIDDGDSPDGGVYAPKRVARRYFELNHQWRSNTLCVLLAAEPVLALDFNRMEAF